jgi:hypothetical protein
MASLARRFIPLRVPLLDNQVPSEELVTGLDQSPKLCSYEGGTG